MSQQKQAILDALLKLDVDTDEHWTSDGQPKVDIVQTLSGDASVTRNAIIDAAPDFTRTTPDLPEEKEPEVSPEQRTQDRSRLEQIRDEQADLDQKIAELQKQRLRLTAEADDIIATRPKSHRNSHVGAVKGYLAQQRKNRAAKRALKK